MASQSRLQFRLSQDSAGTFSTSYNDFASGSLLKPTTKFQELLLTAAQLVAGFALNPAGYDTITVLNLDPTYNVLLDYKATAYANPQPGPTTDYDIVQGQQYALVGPGDMSRLALGLTTRGTGRIQQYAVDPSTITLWGDPAATGNVQVWLEGP